MQKAKMTVVMLAAICCVAATSKAMLNLYVNPDAEGNWVLNLTGQYTGNADMMEFYDDWENTTGWNADQGGYSEDFTCDSVEEFSISNCVNSSVTDPFDIGDGTVAGGTYLGGFHIDDERVILKFYSTFGTSMEDFTSTVFDDTVILKPADKNSFATVWNPGTYTDGDFSVVVSTDVVPEPATLALLGLGALAIRRRRK